MSKLAQYNPLINWINRSINFCPSLQENLAPFYVTANIPLASLLFINIPLQSLDSMVSIPTFETPMSNSKRSNITIIGTAAFLYTYQVQFTPGWKSTEWTQRWVDLWNNLGFSLCAAPSVCRMVSTSDEWEKVRVKVSTDWCVAVEHRRLSSMRVYLCWLSD